MELQGHDPHTHRLVDRRLLPDAKDAADGGDRPFTHHTVQCEGIKPGKDHLVSLVGNRTALYHVSFHQVSKTVVHFRLRELRLVAEDILRNPAVAFHQAFH